MPPASRTLASVLGRRFPIFLLISVLSVTRPVAAAPPRPGPIRLEGLDGYVRQLLREWEVPGVAVAAVAGGKVILAQGWGLRDVKHRLPVTGHTIFPIGSVTKPFTAAVLSTLAESGKLDWDRPMREYLPSFRMHDPVATERATPRDLVAHRTGLARHDALIYHTDLTRAEMVARLRYLEPEREFRSGYGYSNLMYITLGHLAGVLTGTTWEELVTMRLFRPLAMVRSNFSSRMSQKQGDFSLPYRHIGEGMARELRELPFEVGDEAGPCGSINSTAEDMARYLQMYLAAGRPGGVRVLSADAVRQILTPQVVMPDGPRFPESGPNSYGMGLTLNQYRGHERAAHDGSVDGFAAQLTFFPADGVGVVVLTNTDDDWNLLPLVLANDLSDRLLGLLPIDWNGRFVAQRRAGQHAEAEARRTATATERKGTRLSHELRDYAGAYSNPAYGTLTITTVNGLLLRYHGIATPLRHVHYDQFEVSPEPFSQIARARVRFLTSPSGDIAQVAVPMEPTVSDIVFARSTPSK